LVGMVIAAIILILTPNVINATKLRDRLLRVS
jgi:hypothetical protein